MNKKASLFILSSLIWTLACAFLTQPFQKSAAPTPSVESFTSLYTATPQAEPFTPLFTSTASENEYACDAKIVITGVDEVDLGNGKKNVFVRIGVENNGSLWGKIRGPDNDEDTETQKSVFITTKDRSNYGYLDNFSVIQPISVFGQNATIYEVRGAVVTALIPPGFAILGQTVLGEPHYYRFAFQMPNTETPDIITIRNMSVWCIKPENSNAFYRDLVETYHLNEVTDVQPLPSSDNYPNLVGSKLAMPWEGESIEFTEVTRDGNTINIVFNYINTSTYEAYPTLKGYIIGNSRLASCQPIAEFDCESSSGNFYMILQPGQTAEGLIASFIVPENETNLMFVYVEGDIGEINKVYKITP